ncbi:myb-like protein V isoform X2 [Microplitis demolitor]|uniref:myb-like protein V isoform X2 n=1 Tax=Microplitis demolitor TaxID=69319 RepID=UPI00235B6DC3|nr:myb-like protein V isoform X2 [Microplitis demolitor]
MADKLFVLDGKRMEFNLIGFEFNEYHALATSIERHGGEITLPQSFNANGITIINPSTCHSVNYLHDSINSGLLAELKNYCISNLISNFNHNDESTISNELGIKINISDEEDNRNKIISEDLCPAESPDLLASEDDSLATDNEISGDDGSSTNASIFTNSDVTFDEEIDNINSASIEKIEKNPLTKLLCREAVVRCEKLIIDKPETPVVEKKYPSIEKATEKTSENNHRDVENLSAPQSDEDEVINDSDDDMFITYENKNKSRRNTESSDASFHEIFDNSSSERSSQFSIDSDVSDTFPARKKKKMIHLSSESSSDRDYPSRSKKIKKSDRYLVRSKTKAAEKSCPNNDKKVHDSKPSTSKEPQLGTSKEINKHSKDSGKKTMIVMNKKVYPGSPSSSNDESFETRINKKRYSKRRSPRNTNSSSKSRINIDRDVQILDSDSEIDEIIRSPPKKSHLKKCSAKPNGLPAKLSAADNPHKSTNPKYSKLEVKKEYRKKLKSKINPNGDIIDIQDSGSDDNSLDKSVNNRIKWLEERIDVESNMLNPKNKSDKNKSYEPWEQTGMLWYLIKNNRLHEARSLKVWQDMIDEGYLTNRSARGLLFCFLRMLNKLEDYNLPENIRKQLANSHS